MCNSTKLLVANGVYLWPNVNDFTCTKHNGNRLIACTNSYVLLSEGILDCMHKFSLGEWTLESDNRNLCIGLKCMKIYECQKAIRDSKQAYLSINLK